MRSRQPLARKPSLWPICSGSPLFQDERLQALIRTALENNYDVRIAAARVLEAAAQLGVTRSFLLPTVDGTAEVARDRVSEERFLPPPPGGSSDGNTFALGLALTWEVDVWGRIRRQTEAARAESARRRVGPTRCPGHGD